MTIEHDGPFSTSIESLEYYLKECPDKVAYRYLTDGETEGASLTYAELYDASLTIAHKLVNLAEPGDRAILLYPQGLEFVTALYGCFMAGVIAVPVFPPSGKRRVERLENVVKNCRPELALATTDICNQAKSWFAERDVNMDVKWLPTDVPMDASEAKLPELDPQDVALLQYTSGSTGDPKGVEVTHDNLVHNNYALYLASGGQKELCSWLPVYHDMGLIGNLIYAVNCGGTLTLMSPVDFIRKPVRWFRAMSKYKAEASGSPNFGFDLCYRQIADSELEGIDLSHLKALINGAEPIRPATVERFAKRFEKIGFQKASFTPCFGMAEAAALITGGRDSTRDLEVEAEALGENRVVRIKQLSDAVRTKTLACSGPPADGMRIEIVDPDTRVSCPPDTVGEVWVQGRSVARGYWSRKELNKEVFSARLTDATGKTLNSEGEFLRTGDMGFVDGGMLYITGRLKEMFVINGANIYPQDIERSIQEDNPVLQENAGAVFSVEQDDGPDRIIVFQEISRAHIRTVDIDEVIDDIIRRVVASHELFISAVYLLSPGRLPKTTSGKIRRLKCVELYTSGSIPEPLGSRDAGRLKNSGGKTKSDSEDAKTDDGPAFSDITSALALRKARHPQKVAYRFLEGENAQASTLTYHQLYVASRNLACKISEHAKPGDRAMLVLNSGLSFPVAFFACLMSGIVAVPLYVPSGKRRLERFEKVALDCGPVLILGESRSSTKAKAWFAENTALKNMNWIDVDLIGDQAMCELPDIDPDSLAFLQYTSGSTGDPKGVQVTHKNVIHNTWLVKGLLGDTENIVSWLPVYHDMGLIGNIIFNIYNGSTLTFMAPADFIRRPLQWLQAMSDYKADASAAPNFAYDLCVKHISKDALKGVDLSNWKVACNGAEPVRAATMRRFAEHFAETGFSESSFLPCYGLAEATLIVSAAKGPVKTISVDDKAMRNGKIEKVGEEPGGEVQELVSSGAVLKDMEVKIVNPDSNRECSSGMVGEICVKGPSVALGYWQKPEANKEVFETPVLDVDDHPADKNEAYLRTGDLGFMDAGLLYITGRLKEVIIINGANFYPQDIEKTVQNSSQYFQENAGAVFSEEDGQERIVVLQEIARSHLRDFNPEELIDLIRSQISQNHDLVAEAVYLISPGQIPKTTSGKIQRVKCKELYLSAEIPGVLASSDSQGNASGENSTENTAGDSDQATAATLDENALKQWLVAEISRVLELDSGEIDEDVSFAMIGMSSIQGIQISESLSRYIGVRVEPVDLYNYSSVNLLTTYLLEKISTDANEASAGPGPQSQATADVDKAKTAAAQVDNEQESPKTAEDPAVVQKSEGPRGLLARIASLFNRKD
ncbi:MAG: AMP-binding protein [Flavobacteriales bacterium]|nr:AMP-binding protein [Flavobacteriales bacterium]